jgi:hypothetical protein
LFWWSRYGEEGIVIAQLPEFWVLMKFTGTIFLHSTADGKKVLVVNNNNQAAESLTVSTMKATMGMAWLTDFNTSNYVFDQIQLLGKGHLAMSPTGTLATTNISICFGLALEFGGYIF